MPLASSSAVQVRYIAEATFGTTPGAGNCKELRITGETLDYTIGKEASKEINATRTISSVIPTSASASGGITGEISYAEWDTLMAAALMAAPTIYGTNGVQGAASSITFTATTLTATATAGNDAWSNLKKGQWFRLVAPSNANDGKILRVSTTVAPTNTVITLDTNTPAVVGGPVAACLVQTSRFTHGTLQTSFSIERSTPDITQFFNYKGMTPSKMSISESSGALSSIGFEFMGKSAVRAAVTGLPGTPVASYAYDIHSGVAGASVFIWENGVPLTGTFVKSISFDFDNSLRAQDGIGTLGSVGIGQGTINLTGSLSVYLADGAMFDKFVANTNTSIIFSSIDAAGNGYVFTIPVVNITSLKIAAGAKDQDMMLDIQFTGLRDAANADATLRKAIFIDRVGNAVV